MSGPDRGDATRAFATATPGSDSETESPFAPAGAETGCGAPPFRPRYPP